MDSYDILVIILSVALAVLITLAIVFMVFMIKIVRGVNHLTERAQNIIENVETASKVFEKSAGPVAVSRIVANIIDMFREDKGKKK